MQDTFIKKLLLSGLSGGLTSGSRGSGLLGDLLDDTDGDGLSHITNGETSKRGVLCEGLNAHGLLGNKLDHGGISRLDGLGQSLEFLSGTSVDLGGDLGKLAGNVSSVAVENWGVTIVDLSGVVEDDNLSDEELSSKRGVGLGVSSDVTSSDVLNRDVLDVESDVVSGSGLGELDVVHFDGLNLGGNSGGSEGDGNTGLQDSSLDTTDGDRSDTSDLVDILQGDSEGLVRGSLGLGDRVEGLEEGRSLPPGHVLRLLEHVVSVPSRDGDEGDLLGVVSDLLDERLDLSLDFLETGLRVVGRLLVHLVDQNDELLDTEGVGKEGVLSGLSVLVDTSLELSGGGGNNEDSTIGLRGTGNHVLDEVTVTRGIDDSEVVLGGLHL